jgi:hypothetical protein
MKATLKWSGGIKKCPHGEIEPFSEPSGIILYSKPYKKSKDGPLVKGEDFIPKKDSVRCKTCGAIGRVAT